MTKRNFFLAIVVAAKAFVSVLWMIGVAPAAYALPEGNSISIIADDVVDPGLAFRYSIEYFYDFGASPTVTVELPPEVQLVSAGPCTANGTHLACPVNLGRNTIPIDVVANDILDGATLTARATIATTVSASTTTKVTRIARTFVVENTSDSGAGSLRAAIESANARCTDGFPCKVAFRLGDPPASGYHTIALETALPVITAGSLGIDGSTQTRRTVTPVPPVGPTIDLDGSHVSSGNGLTIATCMSTVTAMAIGNFPGAGVRLLQADCPAAAIAPTITACNIGVDPTGVHAAPNERGIVADQRTVIITKNIISGNRRSGIFLVDRPDSDQLQEPIITGNTIGIDRNHQPLGNGASGIYVDGIALIFGNFVAFNGQQGISIAHDGDYVAIGTNSIFANGQIGIDIGIDGPSFSFRPTIVAARYDATTNETLIDMAVILTTGESLPDIHVYANDAPHPSGFGDGQYFLGSFAHAADGKVFTFRTSGDWRGKWVSATQTSVAFIPARPVVRTSEFCRAVKVE
jgi:hypothetical protein